MHDKPYREEWNSSTIKNKNKSFDFVAVVLLVKKSSSESHENMTASTLSLCLAVSVSAAVNRAEMWQEYEIPHEPSFFCSSETNMAAP